MTAAGSGKLKLDRTSALSGRPRPAPILSRKDRPDGGVNVTVMVRRPGWSRLLGGAASAERTFGLDAFGREVLEACNGKRSVGAIVGRFAKAHQVSRAEAELSVTRFLKTMMTKGLVMMEVSKDT